MCENNLYISDVIADTNLLAMGRQESNMFCAIGKLITYNADEVNTLSLAKIKKAARLTKRANDDYISVLENLKKHLESVEIITGNLRGVTHKRIVIFDRFDIDRDNEKITVKAVINKAERENEKDWCMFGGPSPDGRNSTGYFRGHGGFLKIDLDTYLKLGKYDKAMYLTMLHYEDTGELRLNLDAYRHRIGQPDMPYYRLHASIINRSIDRLSAHYIITDRTHVKRHDDDYGILDATYRRIDEATGELCEPTKNAIKDNRIIVLARPDQTAMAVEKGARAFQEIANEPWVGDIDNYSCGDVGATGTVEERVIQTQQKTEGNSETEVIYLDWEDVWK